MIWTLAVPVYMRDPTSHTSELLPSAPSTQPWKQLLTDPSPDTDSNKPPLRLHVHDAHNGRSKVVLENEFHTLINSMPISRLSRQVRAHVAEYCRSIARHVTLEYNTDEPLSLTSTLEMVEDDTHRHGHPGSHATIPNLNPNPKPPEQFHARPKVLTLDGGWGNFRSPNHLVSIISEYVDASDIEHLVLEFKAQSLWETDVIYWPTPEDPLRELVGHVICFPLPFLC